MPIDLSDEALQEQYARRIIHIDMDAFYASVEQRENPDLKGKPLVVGGKPNSRGVVAACSYEARVFGVHSAMPCAHAARLCPNAIFTRPNIPLYRTVSESIHRIFRRHCDIIEPLALDEAYLDVTSAGRPATEIARAIKHDIKTELDLIASAGVSFNKFLAKIASDLDKPDGFFVVRPEQAEALIAKLAVRKFHGIGPVTAKKMSALGIETGGDLKRLSLAALQKHFGSSAEYYYNISRGIDTREVKSHRKRVSIGSETTYSENLDDVEDIVEHLMSLADKVGCSLESKNKEANTLTVKVKFHDFKQITRAKTLEDSIDFSDKAHVEVLLRELVDKAKIDRPVRLLGVSVSKLHEQGTDLRPTQLRLLDD